MNNLFWEVLKKWNDGKKIYWAGNLFRNHQVAMSAIITTSHYLLLSTGETSSLKRLCAYGKRKKWKLNGVTGPSKQAKIFARFWQNLEMEESLAKSKDFEIFHSADAVSRFTLKKGISVQKATSFEWPRIRLWAIQFAHESNPQLDLQASILMAKSMLNHQNLYLLRKEGNTLGMGGFGRFTPNRMIINMVFISKEYRRRGYASALTESLIQKAQKTALSKCLLFSDYLQADNLYKKLGCESVGRFCEIKFN